MIKGIGFVVKLLVGGLIISPIVYALLVSFMRPSEVSGYPPQIFPEALQLENYIAVLERFPLLSFLKNSLIVCAIVIIAQIVTSSLAAYAFAFLISPGKSFCLVSCF